MPTTTTQKFQYMSTDTRDAIISVAANNISNSMRIEDLMSIACNAIQKEIESLNIETQVQILETSPKYRLKELLSSSNSFRNLVYKRH
jgi:hypothetical protein